MVFAHLLVARGERTNLARRRSDVVRRVEVFVAARAPQASGWIDHERMTDASAKNLRAIGPFEDPARPWPLLGMRSHERLDLADELCKQPRPMFFVRLQRFLDRVRQERVGGGG